MLTRKHAEQFAELIRNLKRDNGEDNPIVMETERQLWRILENSNERMDPDRFTKACQI